MAREIRDPSAMRQPEIRATVARIRAEYLEMPGLALTIHQLQRLCGIDAEVCPQVLEALVVADFLVKTPEGHYRRCTEGR